MGLTTASPPEPGLAAGLDAVRQRFSAEDAAGRWNAMYAGETVNVEDDHFRRRRDAAVAEVLARLPAEGEDGKAASKILDLGCGTAPVLTELRRLGLTVEGLDGSADMLTHARQRLWDRNLPTNGLYLGDCRQTGLPDAGYDQIVCLGVISYLEDYAPLLAEAHRLLKPGGHLVLSFRNQFNPVGWDPLLLARRTARWLLTPLLGPRRQPPFEIGRFLDEKEVHAAMTALGFQAEAFRGIGFGPLRWGGHALLGEAAAIRFSQAVEAWLQRVGWRWAEHQLCDVSLWVYRKPYRHES